MFNTSKHPIGLDISDSSLRLIQLKNSGKFELSRKKQIEKLEINCYNSIKIPTGLIVDGEIKKPEEVVKHLDKLLNTAKGGKINNKEVVAVLPTTQTFIKLLQIPAVSEEIIVDKISEEIVKHFPLVLDEMYFDWQLINREKERLNVLVGTAPKETVNQYIQILEQASLQPVALEIEAAAICRCLVPEADNQTIESNPHLIIDLGANNSNVILCSNKAVYFTISAPISGDAITKRISKLLEIDLQKAEKAKQVCGLNKDKCKGAIWEILDDMINNLIDYIEQATSFFKSNYPQEQLQTVILCGGGANFLELDKIIFDHLKIPVIKGDPWLKIKQNQDSKYSQLNKSGLSYITAMGLALREQNNNK